MMPSLDTFRPPAALCGYPADTPMLLALSGGADSRLLLHFCAEQARRDGAALHLAHVHHGIRGHEADRDEQFCRALAEEYGLPLHTHHADVPALAKANGESLEACARRVRYAFFAKLMQELCIPLLLTAHHADDNLETLLFHLIRGAGLSGLGGIAPVRPFAQVTLPDGCPTPVVVRPLLDYTKKEILATCEQMQLAYVTDSTNADVTYSRNRLRSQVIPVLDELMEHPQKQALRACRSLREDEQYLTEVAASFLQQHLDGGRLPRAPLCQAPHPIAKRALRLWVRDVTGRLPSSDRVHALLTLCSADGALRTVQLGGGFAVVAEQRHLRIMREDGTQERTTDDSYEPIPFALGTTAIGQSGMTVTVQAATDTEPTPNAHTNEKNVYNPFIRDTLTFDTMMWLAVQTGDKRLFWRPRCEGDTLLWHGCHRALRKLQNEHHVPVALRRSLPVLCDREGVLWAPLIGQRDTPADAGNTARVHVTLTLPEPFQ